MEGVRLPLRADGQALEVLAAEELLLQLSLKRGRQTNLLANQIAKSLAEACAQRLAPQAATPR
jgi:hypothetical protein